jgi:hypothetical protein
MRKFIIAIAALCAIALASAPAAQAQNAVQYPLAITASDVAAATEWTVPYRQDGALLTWQALGAGSAETVEVKHISAYSATAAYTNTIETAAARNTLHAYPTAYVPPLTYAFATSDVPVTVTSTPPKPVFLQAGDKLTFKLSATNASSVVIIKTTLRD